MAAAALTPIDLEPFLLDPRSPAAQAACDALADTLVATSALVVRDPRVSSAQNDTFLSLLERYYAQPRAATAADERPEVHFQVGVTPEGTEVPLCAGVGPRPTWCAAKLAQLAPAARPAEAQGADLKWRFFWRVSDAAIVSDGGVGDVGSVSRGGGVGDAGMATAALPVVSGGAGVMPRNGGGDAPDDGGGQLDALHAPQVVPAAFAAEWERALDAWGHALLRTAYTVARMAAIGLGLPEGALTSAMAGGPHLLAPTGSDLGKHRALGTVLAGWHRDLNLITLHGRSRFPGLEIWLRDGTKLAPTVPDGHVLIQAGLQLEWLTNGLVQAGMHQVTVTEATRAAVARAELTAAEATRAAAAGAPAARGAPGAAGEPAPLAGADSAAGASVPHLWRVSSTLFAHSNSAATLRPLLTAAPERMARAAGEAGVQTPAVAEPGAYPPVLAGEQVLAELRGIALARSH
ncbi:hypothetical protein KFE25_004640 [Diacronema lutheri]|uniref:Isopenicillin N synthase-like Fe(2+) 2OG dioxygenase domain-containing protein n=2 Tax=Diacronema lutheri TaxID=2081491 RepID=A0A8J5XL77_DIALT|nr:hypothetical protein KFE25_004640 [Diacronema lutheri]